MPRILQNMWFSFSWPGFAYVSLTSYTFTHFPRTFCTFPKKSSNILFSFTIHFSYIIFIYLWLTNLRQISSNSPFPSLIKVSSFILLALKFCKGFRFISLTSLTFAHVRPTFLHIYNRFLICFLALLCTFLLHLTHSLTLSRH
jgi:hypothetical protein